MIPSLRDVARAEAAAKRRRAVDERPELALVDEPRPARPWGWIIVAMTVLVAALLLASALDGPGRDRAKSPKGEGCIVIQSAGYRPGFIAG